MFKKFRSRPELPPRRIAVEMPFDLRSVKAPGDYVKALLEVVEEEGEMDTFDLGGQFYLNFGQKDGVHILYYGTCDLSILMEPTGDGWSGKCVYEARYVGARELLESQGMRLLFKFDNDLYRSDFESDDIEWTEYVLVFEKA